jgi:hypothetical protein
MVLELFYIVSSKGAIWTRICLLFDRSIILTVLSGTRKFDVSCPKTATACYVIERETYFNPICSPIGRTIISPEFTAVSNLDTLSLSITVEFCASLPIFIDLLIHHAGGGGE